MWDTIRLSTVGNFSLRKIALLFVAVLTSALFVAIIQSAATFAEPADWDGDTITYDGQKYTKESGLTLPGIKSSDQTYVYKVDGSDIAYVIVLPESTDTTKEITNISRIKYDYKDSVYSIPSPPEEQKITLAAKTSANGDTTNKTACDIAGVGWIICGPSRWIAEGMDKIYGWISEFLTVKPLSNNTSNGLYQAWEIVRGFANACFIVAFLVIVYSQITTYGISNYEIKKMIPRLIIAAILVNVSYFICAIAVDLSNVMGDSIQHAFVEIRNTLKDSSSTSSSVDWFNFKNVTELLLSGGTLGAGVGIGVAAFTGAAGGSITALVFMLFPILIAGVLSVLVALIILAARQALITVLIVLSPLAFVAFLLPNTQKQFERWRGLFMTMLMVFPMFSLLFGGSQLASFLILQNAEQPSVVLLALFVQVAPLALTPFLIQVSGSLLGRFAGMVNNPQKGLVDRTRNWAKDRSDLHAKRSRERGEGRRFGASRVAYSSDMKRRNREGRKALADSRLDAAWANDRRSKTMRRQTMASDLYKSAGEATAERMFASDMDRDGSPLQGYKGIQRLEQLRVKQMQTADEARWNEAQSKNITTASTHRYAAMATEAQSALKEQHIADSNVAIAQALQKSEYANELQDDTNITLQVRAGGIDKFGATKVKANAMSAVIREGIEAVGAIKTASPLEAGDIDGMKVAFKKAVVENDVASMRAHADMMIEANNPGFAALREVISANEAAIRSDPVTIDIFRHHLNSNGTLNSGGEDIAVWSRDKSNNHRQLDVISRDIKTWSAMKHSQFVGQKASTQIEAFNAIENGKWAITQDVAKAILANDNLNGDIKENMLPYFIARAENNELYMPIR